MRQSLIRQQCENLPRPSHPCQCRQDQLQNIRASNAHMATPSDRDCAASLPNDAEAAGAPVAVIVSGIINARAVGDLAEHGIAAVRPSISAAAADAAPQAVVAARESGVGDIDPGAAQELVVQIADGVEVGADDARAVVPGALMIERQPETAEQAVGIAERDQRAEAVGERIEADLRVGKPARGASQKPLPIAMRLPPSTLKAYPKPSLPCVMLPTSADDRSPR